MDKKLNEIQKQIEVSMAFIKAVEEVKAEKAEREKRINEQAVKAAEERRKEKAEKMAYEAWRRENPPTEEERSEHRRKFKEILEKVKAKGGDNNDEGGAEEN